MLDNLISIIEGLQHIKNELQSYDEAATKQAIILPILHALEWNVFSRSEVHPEYSDGSGSVDYALVLDSHKEPAVFIEAKRTSLDLTNHQQQLCRYAFEVGVELAILTNGLEWWFFLPAERRSRWEKRRFLQINLITETGVEDTARYLITYLGKSQLRSGDSLNRARTALNAALDKEKFAEVIPKVWAMLIAEPDELLIDLLRERVKEECALFPPKDEVMSFLKEQKIPLGPQMSHNSEAKEPPYHRPKPDPLVTPQKRLPLGAKRPGSRTLETIFLIADYVLCKGVDRNTATDLIANERNVNPATIRDQYTRRFGEINTRDFDALLKNPGLLKDALLREFPGDRDSITEFFKNL